MAIHSGLKTILIIWIIFLYQQQQQQQQFMQDLKNH